MEATPTFFSHLLGTYWGTPVRQGPSPRSGYSICIYSGSKPDPKGSSVLHLNLKKEAGMHDSGMHWRIFQGGGERTGHAWDDNMPDPAPTPCEFEDWVVGRISDIIMLLTRCELLKAMNALESDEPQTAEDWRSLQRRLRELEARFSGRPSWPNHDPKEFDAGFLDNAEEEGCNITLGLARCALELGNKREADRLVRRFEKVGWLRSKAFHRMMAEGSDHYVTSGLTCSVLVKESFQSLVEPLLDHFEPFWCEVMSGPMKQLAGYGRERGGLDSQLRFHRWLVSLNRPRLMKQWVDLIVQTDKPAADLVRFASCMHTEVMATIGVALIERAIAHDGSVADYLAQLSALLRCSKQDKRADEVDAELLQRGFADGIEGAIEEYLLLFNRVAEVQRSTGRVPLHERDTVLRLLELEETLNAHWLAHPKPLYERLANEHRFVCGGSTLWVTMCRDHGDYGPVLETMEAIFSDWSFVKLLHDSNRTSLYALVMNGCGGLLDSPDPRALPVAERLVRGALSLFSESPHPHTAYNYACVLARVGDADLALEYVRYCVDHGESKSEIYNDSDFKSLREDPRFLELLAR